MRKGYIYIIALLLNQTLPGQDIYVKADYPRVVTSG